MVRRNVFRDYERSFSTKEIYLGESDEQKYDYEKERRKLIGRYNFLYDNAPLILAQIMYEHQKSKPALCRDIGELIGIDLNNQMPYERNYICDNIHLSIFHLLEEYMFSGEHYQDADLVNLFNTIRYSPSAYLKVKEDFFLKDIKVGVNHKDIAILVLLELMRSFIFNQEYEKTVLVSRLDNVNRYEKTLDPAYLLFANEYVTDTEKSRKKAALDEYFRLSKYRNLGFTSKEVPFLLPNYQLPVISDFSLVGTNKFLKAIWDLSGKLTFDEIREVYFSHHEEIPWDTKTICEEKKDKIERVEGIKPCGSTLYLEEDNIFYRDESFFMICPKCGYMVNIDGLIDNKEIRRRIEFKYWGDKFILRKQAILSELVSLEGIDKAKSLVKERKGI